MWGLATGWVPRRDGQAEAGEAAEAESGEDDGRADCEAGGVGSEEERGVRAGAGEVEECGDGGCETDQVEVMDSLYNSLSSTMDMFGMVFTSLDGLLSACGGDGVMALICWTWIPSSWFQKIPIYLSTFFLQALDWPNGCIRYIKKSGEHYLTKYP